MLGSTKFRGQETRNAPFDPFQIFICGFVKIKIEDGNGNSVAVTADGLSYVRIGKSQTKIDYTDIEYICVTQKVIKVKVFSDLVKYLVIFFTNEKGEYMSIKDAMEYIGRLRA